MKDRSPINSLNQEGRVLIQARMLPEGRLTLEQLGHVRNDYLRYVNQHSLSDAEVAKETNQSPATVKQFRTASDLSTFEDTARALNHWMERHARRQRVSMPVDYVPTRLAEDIRAIAYTAIETQAMAAIVCPSGSGKTMVLEVIARETRGIYLYADPDWAPGAMIGEMARAVGVASGNKGTITEKKGRIVARLRGTSRPILIDEAHQMPGPSLSRLRSIHDQTGVSVIMAGTHEIMDRIDDRSDGRGQLSGRCLRYNALEHVFNADDPTGRSAGRPLFTHEELQQFFANMGVRIDRDAFDLLWAIACLPDHSCLRTVRRVVQLISSKFGVETISRQDVLDALPLLIGELGRHVLKAADRHRREMAKDQKRKSA